jgi:hypothetical protein
MARRACDRADVMASARKDGRRIATLLGDWSGANGAGRLVLANMATMLFELEDRCSGRGLGRELASSAGASSLLMDELSVLDDLNPRSSSTWLVLDQVRRALERSGHQMSPRGQVLLERRCLDGYRRVVRRLRIAKRPELAGEALLRAVGLLGVSIGVTMSAVLDGIAKARSLGSLESRSGEVRRPRPKGKAQGPKAEGPAKAAKAPPESN